MGTMLRAVIFHIALILFLSFSLRAEETNTALGVDLDFYTGPIANDVWSQMKDAGQKFAVVQAWGGRSRNEFAVAQLSGARKIGGMVTAAYILLNYDDRVCRTFAHPVRDRNGKCSGDLVPQAKRGGRWQVRQGMAALGSELAHTAFVAIDVEWFLSAAPSSTAVAQASRRQRIIDAIDEVRSWRKRPVIYTRNAKLHWRDITGCEPDSLERQCRELSALINNHVRPIPLWDVQTGEPELENFNPYAAWTQRAGRQYKLDANLFGLPAGRAIDLNVFQVSLFSPSPVLPVERASATKPVPSSKRNRTRRF
jgi:hypothetical protein